MKKSGFIRNIMILCLLTIALTGCKAISPHIEHEIVFPYLNEDGTRLEGEHYDGEPFTVKISLPESWYLEKAPAQKAGELKLTYLWMSEYSVMNIINSLNGECVGAIGYYPYTPYEGNEDNPQAIYAAIALPNHYKFDVRDNYRPIRTSATGTTAITDVYYSAHIMEDIGLNRLHRINKGILSYNRDLLVYIAVEFDKDALTLKELNEIAKGIEIISN